ncbi:hypothetical protein [Dolichospermum compactum]|uniref:Uncharacterized protein n=1 Tax=Dolichospermum compactum NIES-806 TaxID=1973481 RepID=A0A1Z4V2A8_9CYAN|nr:hypothetical protein [Dolichospermum compactum]BAZ85519.1 hypothetical protein NIES806_17220 [Dolichospermum compactum NIES-806]
MTDIFEKPSIESLLNEIVALNHSWKAAVELFGDDTPLAQSARDLKGCLQVRLLHTYPDQVCLIIDKDTSEQAGEDLYSLRLLTPINNRYDAEHLPVRVAKKLLTEEEIKALTKQY